MSLFHLICKKKLNKQAVFFTSILLIGFVGYLGYDKYYKADKLDIWEFVSSDSGVVIEIGDPEQLTSSLFSDLGFDELGSVIDDHIDSLFYQDFSKQLFSKALLTIHRVSSVSTGYTLIIETKVNSSSELLASLTANSDNLKSRSYLGVRIFEKETRSGLISFQVSNNTIALSNHAFLIEDVVRLNVNSSAPKFRETNANIMKLPKLANDAANIFVNAEKLDDIYSSFKIDKSEPFKKLLFNQFLDASLTSEGLFFNGFTSANADDYLHTFSEQTPLRDQFNYVIPNNVGTITKYLTSDAEVWQSGLVNYWSIHEEEFMLARTDFFKNYNFDNNLFFKSIGNGVCALNFYDTPDNDKLILINLNDQPSVLNQLNTLVEQKARLDNDSIYIESYSDYSIYELKVREFPMLLLGPEHKGFMSTYYLFMDDYLIFGNSISALKDLLDRIENEETWGRQSKYSEFMDKGLGEVNFSFVFNTQQVWPSLIENLNSTWSQYAKDHANFLKSFGLGAFQFSKIDDNFYTNIFLQKSPQKEVTVKSNIKTEVSLAFNYPLISRPFVVRNHNTNLLETILQDSLYNVHLIANTGEKLWTLPVDGPISGTITQIDYFKNRKLQYYFNTDKSTYVVDRLRNTVESFPLKHDFELKSGGVIDYDNSKNYRFLVNDNLGNIYLLDKRGDYLPSWSPLEVNGIHSFTPFHQRVRGRDSFIYLLRDGKLNMVSRKADVLKGFPLTLEGSFESEPYISLGTDYESTIISIISTEGKLFKVNFQGELISESQLFKQSKDASFKLVPDALKKTYILARQESNRVVILDNVGKELFTKDYLSSGELKIQYYYFTPENQICVITDSDQELTYMYNLEGELLNSGPINSSEEIGIIYSENKNEFTVYSVWGDTYRVSKF